MRRLFAALVAAGFSLGVSPAVGQGHTVQTLRGWCKQPQDTYDFAICLGYVTGTADTLVEIGASNKLGMCGRPTYGVAIQAFLNWADSHPEYWDRDKSFGAIVALHEKWPCK